MERWFTLVHRALRKQHIAYRGQDQSDEREIRVVHAYCQPRNVSVATEASTNKYSLPDYGLA
jgi:hypothetical protein